MAIKFLLENKADQYITDKVNELIEGLITRDEFNKQIASLVSDELTEDQIISIVNAAIQKAENDGTIATEAWAEEQDSAVMQYCSDQFKTLQTLITTNASNFITHQNTDTFRWNDAYQSEYDSMVRDAKMQGLIPDDTAKEQFSTQYTVTNELGGIAQITSYNNTADTPFIIAINGVNVYTGNGLPVGNAVTKSFLLKMNDIIKVTNSVNAFYYTPFIQDPDFKSVINSLIPIGRTFQNPLYQDTAHTTKLNNAKVNYYFAGDTTQSLFCFSKRPTENAIDQGTWSDGQYSNASPGIIPDYTIYQVELTDEMVNEGVQVSFCPTKTNITLDAIYRDQLLPSMLEGFIVDGIPVANSLTDRITNIENNFVKKTDIVVDSTPTQDSNNFVTSGGVFDALDKKTDKYNATIDVTKTLADIQIGDDLSGITVTLPNPLDITTPEGSVTNVQLLQFQNGGSLRATYNISTKQYNINYDDGMNATQWYYGTDLVPVITSFTFPANSVVSATPDLFNASLNGTWRNQIELIGLTQPVFSEITIKYLFDRLNDLANNLSSHIGADAKLYQSFYAKIMNDVQDRLDSGDTVSYDMQNGVVIKDAAASLLAINLATTYTAPSDGIITTVYKATLLGVSPTVTVNDTAVFGDGLGLLGLGTGTPVTSTVKAGDTIAISGSLGLLTSFNCTFYPQK